jgi:hypothetical protein
MGFRVLVLGKDVMRMLVMVTAPQQMSVGNVVSEFTWEANNETVARLKVAQINKESLEATILNLDMDNERAGRELIKSVMRHLETTDLVVNTNGKFVDFYSKMGFDLRQLIVDNHEKKYTLTYSPMTWEH